MSREERTLTGERLEQLVESARHADPAALAQLCEHFHPKIYRYMLYRVSRPEDAEDLAAEVCVRALSSLPKQRGFFPAWIFRIAANLLTDARRRSRVRQEVEMSEELAGSLVDPTPGLENVELGLQLERAVEKLSPEQREVIRLRFIEGYDAKEISQIQGRSVEAVRAMQYRALEALRQMSQAEIGG